MRSKGSGERFSRKGAKTQSLGIRIPNPVFRPYLAPWREKNPESEKIVIMQRRQDAKFEKIDSWNYFLLSS